MATRALSPVVTEALALYQAERAHACPERARGRLSHLLTVMEPSDRSAYYDGVARMVERERRPDDGASYQAWMDRLRLEHGWPAQEPR